MRKIKNRLQSIAVALLLLASADAVFAQALPIPPPSPWQTVKQQFATSSIEIDYSRPSVKGRQIFGDVVPFDKVWRTGANAATTIEFGDEVTINGTKVAKGKYGLLTIPNAKEWQVVISKDVNVTSANAYKPKNDVVRIPVKPATLNDAVETFTISVENITSTRADVQLKWDRTLISFPITADIDATIMKSIEKAEADGKLPLHQAANYYFENGKDLNKALKWSTEAVKQNPDAFWMSHLKANIEYKLKDFKAALASAEMSLAKAEKSQDDAYTKKNKTLIGQIKAALK